MIPATALLFGAILDGIPESAVIGLGLLEDPAVSVPVLAAVFISNLPEGFVSAHGDEEPAGLAHVIRSGRSSSSLRGVVGRWATGCSTAPPETGSAESRRSPRAPC